MLYGRDVSVEWSSNTTNGGWRKAWPLSHEICCALERFSALEWDADVDTVATFKALCPQSWTRRAVFTFSGAYPNLQSSVES